MLLRKAMNHYKQQRLEAWSRVPFFNLGALDTGPVNNGDWPSKDSEFLVVLV